MNWVQWIAANWPALKHGRKLVAPAWLPPARAAGFRPISVATPEGQCADWALPYDDGSRVHVHEFPDGSRNVHRDQYNPDAGLGHMALHLLTETDVGPVLAGVLIVVLVARSLGQ